MLEEKERTKKPVEKGEKNNLLKKEEKQHTGKEGAKAQPIEKEGARTKNPTEKKGRKKLIKKKKKRGQQTNRKIKKRPTEKY